MDLKKFQKEYHWMNGLSEFFEFTGQKDRWDHIHKALYHDNWFRKRDVMIELCSMPNSNPAHVKAWMTALQHEKLEDVELKPQLLATLFRKYMLEDEFLVNTCKFINYWAEGDKAAEMPDMNDFLSRGQVRSKLWIVSELAKIVDGSIGNVVFYGGWYNFIAHMLFTQFNVNKIYSIDLDEKCVNPSKRLYHDQVEQGRFIPLTRDVNTLSWKGKELQYLDHNIRTRLLKEKEDEIRQHNLDVNEMATVTIDKMNMVINTSCEHMDDTWFEKLPSGTFVLLHQNDYFDNEQHMNCCKDLEAVKKKYPMQSIYYEGELDTFLYNRFMLIGVK